VTYSSPSGNALSIHQATQNDYIVPHATLFEVITSRSAGDTIDPELERSVRALLLEIAIDDQNEAGLIDMLHAKKDWNTILSGGQKRKISILGAILKRPDIVILDEVFNGLDSTSVKNAQRMLKTYLPKTLMLIVDHNYELNNYEGFYDARLHLENKALRIVEL
jgi:ABC-type uncharacterized transport system fused permease/ATPase subunit